MPNSQPTIRLQPRRILFVLLGMIVLLVILSIWGQYLKYFQSFADIRPWMEFWLDLLIHKFDLNAETNIPTWYNTVLLLASSLFFFIIAAAKTAAADKFRYHWYGLAFLWLYFSIDELAVLHETLIKPVRNMTHLSSWFYFAWVVPGLIILAVLAVMYLGFFLHLSPRYKILFLASMLLYFGGAVGGEMLSGHFAQTIGLRNFTFAAYASLEESLELIGASLLIFTLLRYIEEYYHGVQIIPGKK